MALKDLIGERFGRLVVIRQDGFYVSPQGKRQRKWYCECDCGGNKSTTTHQLTSGGVKSCGCLKKETGLLNLKDCAKRKYNKYDLTGEYGIGWTTNTNQKFYFDLEDYDLIKDYCWIESIYGYIISTTLKTTTFIHRLVTRASEEYDVDHIKHNTKDNRKSELRIVTKSQNMMNKGLQSNNKSGVAGVIWREKTNNWEVNIRVNGKQKYLGRYVNFEDAVKVRKEAEKKYFAEFSYDNSMNNNEDYVNPAC